MQTSATESIKTILITGASKRLGLFLTENFIRMGHRVIAFSRTSNIAVIKGGNQDRLDWVCVGDYTEGAIQLAVEDVKKRYSKVDLVIHNASIYEADNLHSDDHFDFYTHLFHIHMRVPAQINMLLKPLLNTADSLSTDSVNTDKAKSESTPAALGSIIHITDIYADNPNEDYSLYCSTKAGLENLRKSFAKKYAPHIRVNTIQPGPIKFLESHNSGHKNQVMSETLLAFEGGFEPILQAVLMLMANNYITGTTIKVDGGRSLKRS